MITDKQILTLDDIISQSAYLGNKTLNLKKCIDLGLNVPRFVAIPSQVVPIILGDKKARDDIADRIADFLKCGTYTVRSSAQEEDGDVRSHAGKFLSRTDLSKKEIGHAMFEVVSHANTILNGKIDRFSLLIQEFIAPEISGIAFTRNPFGSREMIIEYSRCEGSKLAQGEIEPDRIFTYWNQNNEKLEEKIFGIKIINYFKKIESAYGFPQDIEWCIKDQKLYILQTRPITTFSKIKYEEIIITEALLPKTNKFYFQKTEISEIAPRPAPVTMDLLKKIYADNGPIHRVYKKYKINYCAEDFLTIIGNELYVDKEKELRAIFPSYTYLRSKKFVHRFKEHKHAFKTLRNIISLQRIDPTRNNSLFQRLKQKIEGAQPLIQRFEDIISFFLDDYELIFEINLLATIAMKRLTGTIIRQDIHVSDILDGKKIFLDYEALSSSPAKDLLGNSLDLTDVTPFICGLKIHKQPSKGCEEWWRGVSEYKKDYFKKKIIDFLFYDLLREMGRWLTVKNTNLMRNYLHELAVKHDFKRKENIYFSNFANICSDNLNEGECIAKRRTYEKFDCFTFPASLTSDYVTENAELTGVSPGSAVGILTDIRSINEVKVGNKDIILYTEMLSPELVKYFDRISGIVSRNGGLLSHLSIIAREMKIPAVVGFSPENSLIKFGDRVMICGNGNGKDRKVEE